MFARSQWPRWITGDGYYGTKTNLSSIVFLHESDVLLLNDARQIDLRDAEKNRAGGAHHPHGPTGDQRREDVNEPRGRAHCHEHHTGVHDLFDYSSLRPNSQPSCSKHRTPIE